MNIITDNLKSDEGEILFSDGGEPENILKMGVRFREKLGFMPQYPGMYPNFSIERFMWYMATLKDVGSHLKGKAKREYIKNEIQNILKAVELDDIPRRKIGALSGGMKQRLALAQAVLGNPFVLILDEPTAGLDPKQRIAIRNFISRIAFDKIVIIATHVVSDVEFVARDVIMLKKGVIVDNAPPAELVRKIEGKVWNLPAPEGEVVELQQKYRVTNITRDDKTGDAILRVLSEEEPASESGKSATNVAPTLEDYYLYVFGEESGGN
jgi:ABC-type multidrug transport system ATPase subunit